MLPSHSPPNGPPARLARVSALRLVVPRRHVRDIVQSELRTRPFVAGGAATVAVATARALGAALLCGRPTTEAIIPMGTGRLHQLRAADERRGLGRGSRVEKAHTPVGHRMPADVTIVVCDVHLVTGPGQGRGQGRGLGSVWEDVLLGRSGATRTPQLFAPATRMRTEHTCCAPVRMGVGVAVR